MKKTSKVLGYLILLGCIVFGLVYKIMNPDLTDMRIALNTWYIYLVAFPGFCLVVWGMEG